MQIRNATAALAVTLTTFLLVAGMATQALAIPVYGTDASGELIGSRDVGPGGGLTGFNAYDNGSFTVDWEITIGVNTAHYKYTFSGIGNKSISHIVFDISDDCDGDPLCVTNALINGSPATTEYGNTDGVTGGIKLDGVDGPDGAVYEFDSNRVPVYGHLAVKDGGGPETCLAPGGSNIVCSNQLLGLGDPEDINDFVARPDGAVIPEPSTAALLGLSMASLGIWRHRRSD